MNARASKCYQQHQYQITGRLKGGGHIIGPQAMGGQGGMPHMGGGPGIGPHGLIIGGHAGGLTFEIFLGIGLGMAEAEYPPMGGQAAREGGHPVGRHGPAE